MTNFIAFILSFIAFFGIYPKDCTVIYSDKEVIQLEDSAGEVWEYLPEENDNWQIGQSVILLMSDNGTDTIYDDIIININPVK